MSAGLTIATLHTKSNIDNYLVWEQSIKHQWHVSMHIPIQWWGSLQAHALIQISYTLYKELTLASTIPHVYNECANYIYVNAVLALPRVATYLNIFIMYSWY